MESTPNNLTRLAYVSTAIRDMADEELAELLKQSRRDNEAADITGFLMYADRSFFQVIEGGWEAIDTLYGKIVKDSRHSGVTRILFEPADARVFPNWQMAFQRYSQLADAPVEGYRDLVLECQSLEGTTQPVTDAARIESMILTMRQNCLRA